MYSHQKLKRVYIYNKGSNLYIYNSNIARIYRNDKKRKEVRIFFKKEIKKGLLLLLVYLVVFCVKKN